ncbi:MAG: DUF4342 domain-containing protein [Dehalococcoidia bacterium]|nr:MAG: DUF4342 domain-containing protein [Dehalococcoidia bacterium]
MVVKGCKIALTLKEEFKVSGSELVSRVKQLVWEGNVRRVRVIHKQKTLLDIPLSIGAPVAAVSIVTAPLLAAVAAVAAMVTECTIEVERIESNKEDNDPN